MKKQLLLGLICVLFFICIAGCSSVSPEDSENSTVSSENSENSTVSSENSENSTVSSEISETSILDTSSGTTESLINSYLISAWSGNYFKNGDLTAQIKNGVLFINGESTGQIPDMGPYENSTIGIKILHSDEEGTWVFDRMEGLLELWKKGFRMIKRSLHGFGYETQLVFNGNCIVAKYGSRIQVLDLNGKTLDTFDEIVDFMAIDNSILISNFNHDNFSIDKNGNVKNLESHYVRFRGTQAKTPNDKGANCCQSSTGTYFVDAEGQFWKIAENQKMLAILPEGEGYELTWINSETEEYVISVYNKHDVNYTICIIRSNRAVEIVTSSAIDYNVAYQMLYWMDQEGKVYSQHWTDTSALELFFEAGAYAVSPCTDEAQGALVPQDKANWEGYGYNNIYSPYGEKK